MSKKVSKAEYQKLIGYLSLADSLDIDVGYPCYLENSRTVFVEFKIKSSVFSRDLSEFLEELSPKFTYFNREQIKYEVDRGQDYLSYQVYDYIKFHIEVDHA